MTATARILGAAEGDAGTVLAVPRGAIQTIDGQPFVFVQREPGKFEMRGVERGADVDGEVEIARGLSGDETIVTDGTFILKSEALKAQMGAND
jgi:cobalt-zinc-cadmium efflux system membrane fusion protein